MRILVIGSNGFIGRVLVDRLVNRGYEIAGLDLTKAPADLERSWKCFTGSILSPDDIMKAAEGVELIITLAAKHHDFGISKDEYFQVNENGTRILLDCAGRLGIKKIIFYSTVAVYGMQKVPTTENTVPRPDNPYGKSKLAGEKVIRKWAEEDRSRSIIIIRPAVVFGPNNFANVYNLIDKIYRKKFIFVGDGKNIKSVAYVDNLVDANIFLIDHLKPGIQVFNYSDEPQMTSVQTVEAITACMPHGIPKLKIPLVVAISLGSFLDVAAKITRRNFPITAARMKKFATSTYHTAWKIRELGFVQKIEPREGIRRMVEWYLKNEV